MRIFEKDFMIIFCIKNHEEVLNHPYHNFLNMSAINYIKKCIPSIMASVTFLVLSVGNVRGEISDIINEVVVNTSIHNLTNENSPIISSQIRSVNENSAVGTNVGGPIAASDLDGETLTYSIISGNTGNAFIINSTTGQIKVSSPILNYELISTYSLTVQVCDNGSPSKCSNAIITINLNDINENPNQPVIGKATYTIPEHSIMNTMVGIIAGSDADSYQTIDYKITGGTGVGKFAVDYTGKITVIGPLDYETSTSYALEITVSDNGQPSRSSSATIIINLTNIPEPVPYLWNLYYSPCSLNNVTTLTSDLISNDYYFLGWSVSPGGSTLGIVNPESSVTSALTGTTYMGKIGTVGGNNLITNGNFEAGNVVTGFTSEYTYVAGSASISSPGQFGITRDADSKVPYFVESVDQTIGDGSGYYMCVDGDAVLDVKVYSTTVNVVAGQKYLFSAWLSNAHDDIAPIDVNARAKLKFDVAGIDIGGIELDGTVGVWQRFYAIYTATTTGTITISIENNNSNGSRNDFFLDDVTFTSFTATETRSITVPGCPGIIEINTAPVISSGTFSVPENCVAGTIVGNVEAVDADNDILSYSIVSGNSAGKFSINSSTGKITVVGDLDYEAVSSYNLTVAVEDGFQSNSAEITINVEDVSEVISAVDKGIETSQNLKGYPNPFKESINIVLTSTSEMATVIVKDINGRILYKEKHPTNNTITIGENLESGVYIIEAISETDSRVIKVLKLE